MHGGNPDHTKPLVAFVVLVVVTAVTLGSSLARSNADVIAAGIGPAPGALLRPAGTFPSGHQVAHATAARPSAARWVPEGFGLDTSAEPVGTPPGRAGSGRPKAAPAAQAFPRSASGRSALAGTPGAGTGAPSSVGGAARTSSQATGRQDAPHGPRHGDTGRRARITATAVRVALVRLAG